MLDSRRKVLWVVAGLALVVVLAVGGYLVWQTTANPYAGLTLTRETQMEDVTRQLLTQRIAVTQASISAEEAQGGKASLQSYSALASDAYILGDLVMARVALEEVLNQNSILSSAWNSYGNVLAQMGDLELAESAYLEAIEITPAAEYYMDYAMFLQTYGVERDEEIRLVLEHAVATVGQRTEFMVALAEWYLAHNDCQAAIDHYQVAKTLSPDNTSIVDDLAAARATCYSAE